MEAVSTNNCSCKTKTSVKTIIPTVSIESLDDYQKDLENIIKAVYVRKSKTYKTRLRSSL